MAVWVRRSSVSDMERGAARCNLVCGSGCGHVFFVFFRGVLAYYG